MYNPEPINAAMGAKRLTNPKVAESADVSIGTVSAIRNGNPNVTLPSLKAVAEAVGYQVEIHFIPKPEPHTTHV